MQLKLIFVILGSVLVSGLMASPLPHDSSLSLRQTENGVTANDYIELWRESAKVHNGNIVYYGPSNITLRATQNVDSESLDHEKRSSSCSITGTTSCHTSNAARNENCDRLVTELQADGSVSVPQSPRQICYQGVSSSDEYCCVSWHNVIPNLRKQDLFNPANTSELKLHHPGSMPARQISALY
ncbi:hypothetical protein DPV78_003267 [Talaromyces pinophilus]|nr:hypothetical protein DPV78_003267 [Talaromyces pinophilus]